MVHRLPYDRWLAASRELKAIRFRARMTGSDLLEDALARAIHSLDIERIPMVAALELKYAAQLVKYPSLRRMLGSLADGLLIYTSAEWPACAVVQFPV